MIFLYTMPGCNACRFARKWFNDHHIDFIERSLTTQPLTKKEFYWMLSLTKNGLNEILSTHSFSYKKIKDQLDSFTLGELYREIQKDPSLLKRPIITDRHKKFLTGFSEDRIRLFLPRPVRKQALNDILLVDHLAQFDIHGNYFSSCTYQVPL